MGAVEFPDPLAPWDDERTPALALVARGDQIRTIDPARFEIRSQSRPDRRYLVSVLRDRWSCTCAYHRASRRVCMHILAVRFREQVSPAEGATRGSSASSGA